MMRQKTILSFFQKPSPGNQNPCGTSSAADDRPFSKLPNQPDETISFVSSDSKRPAAVTSSDSCIEIETPPEKVPRRVLPVIETYCVDGERPSLFSSIMHKFSRGSGTENAQIETAAKQR